MLVLLPTLANMTIYHLSVNHIITMYTGCQAIQYKVGGLNMEKPLKVLFTFQVGLYHTLHELLAEQTD